MKKIKTLLVDDDYLVLQDLKKMVEWEALGFQIIDTVANGKQAQEQAEKNMPDLIVSDISMPVMDGFDFIEEIRKKNPRIYVILISSYASFDYARRALHNHIHSYILKNEMTAESLTKELLQAKKYIFQNESLQKEEMEMVLKKYFAAKSETQMSGPQIMRQKFVFFFVAEQIPLEKLKQHFEYILEAGTRLNREAKSTVEEISSDIYTFSQEEFMVVAMPGEIFGKPFSETSVSKVYWTLRDKIRKTEKAAVQIYVIPEKLSVKDGKKEFYHVLPWLHFFNSFPEYAKWDLSEFRGKQFVGVAQGFSYDCLKKSWNHPEIFIKEFRHYVDILFESMDADGIFMLYHNIFFQLEELSGHMAVSYTHLFRSSATLLKDTQAGVMASVFSMSTSMEAVFWSASQFSVSRSSRTTMMPVSSRAVIKSFVRAEKRLRIVARALSSLFCFVSTRKTARRTLVAM